MKIFASKIDELKIENDDLTNFKITFCETAIVLRGELIEDGKSEGFYPAGVIANFFIPTEKGYLSSEWKKSKFNKMNGVTVTDELLTELMPFIQNEAPKHFVRKTEGWGAAGVIANHINSKIDYASNKMRQ